MKTNYRTLRCLYHSMAFEQFAVTMVDSIGDECIILELYISSWLPRETCVSIMNSAYRTGERTIECYRHRVVEDRCAWTNFFGFRVWNAHKTRGRTENKSKNCTSIFAGLETHSPFRGNIQERMMKAGIVEWARAVFKIRSNPHGVRAVLVEVIRLYINQICLGYWTYLHLITFQ